MSTKTETPDHSTLAGRVQALGGGGLPQTVLRLMQTTEQRRREIRADQRYSKQYRDEQIAALDREEEAGIFNARDAEIAEARKVAETRKARIVSQLRAQFAHQAPSPAETASEQAERHARATRDTLALLPALTTAQAMSDPDDLIDLFEESLHAQHDARVRTLGPVIIARLAALVEQEHEGARAAWMSAREQFDGYKKAHPSLARQLKAAEEDLRNVAAPIERQYQRAMEYFRVGRSQQGLTL